MKPIVSSLAEVFCNCSSSLLSPEPFWGYEGPYLAEMTISEIHSGVAQSLGRRSLAGGLFLICG